jgi:hypothetical protein
MYEVCELLKADDYLKKVLPIIVNNAKKIFNNIGRLEYIAQYFC